MMPIGANWRRFGAIDTQRRTAQTAPCANSELELKLQFRNGIGAALGAVGFGAVRSCELAQNGAELAQRGWGDRAAVQATLRRILKPLADGSELPNKAALLAAMRAALERYAPENLDLLPPIS